MSRNILFLTLRVFSATGGVEKMSRIIGNVLEDHHQATAAEYRILSSHDKVDQAQRQRYFPVRRFTGYGLSRIRFVLSALYHGCRTDLLLLSHVNLLPVAWIIKKIRPSLRVVMMAHGIEMWQLPLGRKQRMLSCLNDVFCVSRYTKDRIVSLPELSQVRCVVMNNALDPFLEVPDAGSRNRALDLRRRYGLQGQPFVLFTLTRMDASERYKGYDRVIEAMSQLNPEESDIVYLIGGSSDPAERAYVESLIQEKRLEGRVILAGFIADAELADHFQLADAYIMPSLYEGFGIVFIEALFFGKPVIAGNRDGSVDALLGGELGTLIDPLDVTAIREAIRSVRRSASPAESRYRRLMEVFSYPSYRQRFLDSLESTT